MNTNRIVPVSKNVSWIGAFDPDIVTFDIVMETKYGTTYNAYFIDAEKKTIVETVKERFSTEFLNKISKFTPLSELSYIVLNHTEPDHSGSLKHLLKEAVNATVVGSGNTIRYLKDIVGFEFPHIVVKDGDVIDLGSDKLHFIAAPNLHWPDSTYSYLENEQLLFTCDSFGAHFCHDGIFDDTAGNYDDAFVYYFDVILKPFSKFMLKAIEKIKPLTISAICPGHGPVLRSNWKRMVDMSEEMSKKYLEEITSETENILIAFVSAYGYSGNIASFIAEGIKQSYPNNVELLDIENLPASLVAEKIERCTALLIGSPTINQNTLPQIYQTFALISPLRDKGKPAAAFGSYGWSGEAVKIIEENLKVLKLNVVQEGLAIKFNPNEEAKQQCVEFGRSFAEFLKNRCNTK